MNGATKRYLAYSAVATAATLLAAFIGVRIVPELALASQALCASLGLFGGVLLRQLLKRPVDADGVARQVATGSALMGTLFACSRALDQPLFLLAGFVLGVTVSVYALLKELDDHVSAKALFLTPMVQMMILVLTLS